MTPETLVEACTELVTINERPFELLEDSGFKKIVNPILKVFGSEVSITKRTIRSEVVKKAKKSS